jgi:AhpC/TSA antioxidant enzyme
MKETTQTAMKRLPRTPKAPSRKALPAMDDSSHHTASTVLFNEKNSIFSRSPRTNKKSNAVKADSQPRTPIRTERPNSPGVLITPRLPVTVAASLPTLYSASTTLVPVNLTFNQVREEPYVVNIQQAHRMVLTSQVDRPRASICFVVKRPGCVLCQEQGDALKALIAEFSQQSVAPWAVIKETGVDDTGLLSLYQNHFPFSFYRDTNLCLYKALGDRRVTVTDMATKLLPAKRRVRHKGLTGNIIGLGEGMILGGIVIFDQHGVIQYAHAEKFGLELPLAEIRRALQQVIDPAGELYDKATQLPL